MDKACLAPICLTCQIGKAPSDSAQLSFLLLVEICPSFCAWETLFAKSCHHLLQGLYHTTINCYLHKPTSSSELPSSLALLDASSSCRYKERVPSKIPSSLHTADNEWFFTKTQNLNHPHLIRRSEISHVQKTRLFFYQNPKAQFSSPQHTWSLSCEIHTPQTTLLCQNPKAQFSLPHHSWFLALWNSHTTAIVLVPKSTDNILVLKARAQFSLTESYLIFKVWNSHTTDNLVVPKSKKTQELDSLHLIIPGVQVVKETNIWKTKTNIWKTKCSCAENPRA